MRPCMGIQLCLCYFIVCICSGIFYVCVRVSVYFCVYTVACDFFFDAFPKGCGHRHVGRPSAGQCGAAHGDMPGKKLKIKKPRRDYMMLSFYFLLFLFIFLCIYICSCFYT